MKEVRAIVFRYLTDADFFNINKPAGAEARGGGQSYIDFSTTDVPVAEWERFLQGVPGLRRTIGAQGPRWGLQVSSVGIPAGNLQPCEIYQRREASVIIARQKLGTSRSNRISAWHPIHGFPEPSDPNDRSQCPPGLVVFLARTGDEVWAGWFLNDGHSTPVHADRRAPRSLAPMLEVPRGHAKRARMIECAGLFLDEAQAEPPFFTTRPARAGAHSRVATAPGRKDPTEAEFDLDTETPAPSLTYSVVKVRRRNLRAVSALKALYENTCQITGTDHLFRKMDGSYYTEVHHLVPLGLGGADDPRNMVVLSPQLHKMLHHANVTPIRLKDIRKGDDGRWFLEIRINGQAYRIHWHPAHARLVRKQD